jgi:deoxyribonuclease V
MNICLDVQYHDVGAQAAAVLFGGWTDPRPAHLASLAIDNVAEYQPGAFYKRELPCLLALLATITIPLDYIVIDGFVYLDDQHKYGLGAHLYTALAGQIPVIGVAKTPFQGAPSLPVLRGQSQQPLLVSSIGCDSAQAAAWVAQMHGIHRIPTLLKAVDQLARGYL